MHISLNWLQQLVDVRFPSAANRPTPDQATAGLAAEDLAHLLTMAGFEVEDLEDRRAWADGVVVGWVTQREKHPDADRLSVCTVEIGADQPLTIVCGAANVRAQIRVPVATIGTYLPKIDLKLKPSQLRGVPSEGMICSLKELGLEKESDGIHIFEQDVAPGTDVRPLLGLEDVILDLSSTANRADALSMVGIAREVRALTGGTLKLPQIEIQTYPVAATQLQLKIAATEACPTYTGTLIEGVKIGPSPDWLQQRLQAAGTRPINNVVDITNYVLLEWGQPLHAFDADKIRQVTGQAALTLGVRFGQAGETLRTLDGVDRKLQPQTLVITATGDSRGGDSRGGDSAIALAGVMGGEATEVDETTTNLMLEAAWFEPVAVRRSARSQGLRTEASTRYERGVNQAELAIATQRAIDLILELAGGEVIAQAQTEAQPERLWSNPIELRLDRLNAILGPVRLEPNPASPNSDPAQTTVLQASQVEAILTALGCDLSPLSKNNTWTVTAPPYRYRDLEREIDLIEEVARLHGYDNFCDTLPQASGLGKLSAEQRILRRIRESLRGAGLTEVIHYSLGKPEHENQIKLANPLLAEYSALRIEMLQGLIDAFQYNLEQGNGPLWGFELGRIFWQDGETLREGDRLAGILGGDPSHGSWQRSGKPKPTTWYEAKGVLEMVFVRLGLAIGWQTEGSNRLLHPGRTAALMLRGRPCGLFGQLHPEVCRDRGLPPEVYAFDLDLAALIVALNDDDGRKVPLLKPFSAFPAADRDLAFFVDQTVSVADLTRLIEKTAGKLLETVELFDEYRGATVPEGQRSLAFRLVYRVGDRTLTDPDIDPIQQKIRDKLVQQYKVELRS